MSQQIPIFIYKREDGGITVSPEKPEGVKYTEAVRIIADEGKLVTKDGVNFYSIIDDESIEGYYEIDDLEDKDEIQNS